MTIQWQVSDHRAADPFYSAMKGADEINDATAELHHGWGHDHN